MECRPLSARRQPRPEGQRLTEPRRQPFTLANAMFLVGAMTPGFILLRIAASFGLFRADPFAPGLDFVEYLLRGGRVCPFQLDAPRRR